MHDHGPAMSQDAFSPEADDCPFTLVELPCGCQDVHYNLPRDSILPVIMRQPRKFIPERIHGVLILAIELTHVNTRALAECMICKTIRWTGLRQLKRGECVKCVTCCKYNDAKPRYSAGNLVGHFEILGISGRSGSGGYRYLVKDDRCNHESLTLDSPSHPLVGTRTICGCPGLFTTSQGYLILQWNSPSGKAVKVALHRIIMEREIGRELLPEENIHHVNGVRDDNRPENLELWNTCQPSGQRIEDKLAWARHLMTLYAPEELNR